MTKRLIARVAATDTATRLSTLNPREREVAVEVGPRQAERRDSRGLHLSIPTVKTQVSAILTKLDLNNRVQIALLTHDAGLLD